MVRGKHQRVFWEFREYVTPIVTYHWEKICPYQKSFVFKLVDFLSSDLDTSTNTHISTSC